MTRVVVEEVDLTEVKLLFRLPGSGEFQAGWPLFCLHTLCIDVGTPHRSLRHPNHAWLEEHSIIIDSTHGK